MSLCSTLVIEVSAFDGVVDGNGHVKDTTIGAIALVVLQMIKNCPLTLQRRAIDLSLEKRSQGSDPWLLSIHI